MDEKIKRNAHFSKERHCTSLLLQNTKIEKKKKKRKREMPLYPGMIPEPIR